MMYFVSICFMNNFIDEDKTINLLVNLASGCWAHTRTQSTVLWSYKKDKQDKA